MKNFTMLALVLGFCCLGTTAQAQYSKGDLTGSAGFSFGLIGYGFGYAGSSSIGFPALSANVEYSLDDRFAVGPYLGYFSRSYSYSSYRDRFSVISFGGRGTFHASSSLNEWIGLSIDEEKWDLYATVLLGFEIYRWNYDDTFDSSIYNHSTGRLIFGPVLGARYYFNPALGVYFEAGRGTFGWGTLGVSAKF